MKRKIEAILIDIDGCIVNTESGEKPVDDYYEGLKILSSYVQLANKGLFPKIDLCSGRDRNYVEAVSFFIGMPNCWSIIESGIALFNPATKELILNPVLTPEVKESFGEIQKIIPEILQPGFFLYPGNMLNIAIERKNGFNEPIENCFQTIKKKLQSLGLEKFVNIRHSAIAVDISPAGIDKASGVKFWTEKTGIGPEKIMGIGDSNGDFPLLNAVGFIACPANASDECKKLVREKPGYISPFPHAAGVADIIHHFKLWM